MRNTLLLLALTSAACFSQESPSPTPTPPPTTSVQIINATSVPSISLSVNGRNDYPDFPQGLYTGDAPTEMLSVKYLATDKASNASIESDLIRYEPNKNYSLIIMGDFSTDVPPGQLPQPGVTYETPEKPYPPNVLFRVHSHDLKTSESPVRLTVINAMPRKNLQFGISSTPKKHIAPGSELILSNQPASFEYEAEIDGEKIPVLMNQEGNVRNALIIFYLKEGKPAFSRAFENTTKPVNSASRD